MGLRISTGLGPVRFNAPIPKAVVAVVAGLCCCGGVVNAFNGDDDKKPRSAVPVESKYVYTSRPAPTTAVTTQASPSPKRTTAKPSPRPTVRKTTARPKPSPKPVKKTTAPTTDKNYGTCKEVISRGLGPYVKGKDPEYYWYRDTDSDGVVCER